MSNRLKTFIARKPIKTLRRLKRLKLLETLTFFKTQCLLIEAQKLSLLWSERLITVGLRLSIMLVGILPMRHFVRIYRSVLMLTSASMLSLACSVFSLSSWARPWFTGPLLAPAGLVMPAGHTNLETYGIYTANEGAFNRRRHVAQNVNRGDGSSVMPIFSHGLAENFDITYVTSYIFNHSQRFTSQEIGDVIGLLGYQALKQKDSAWLPSLRVVILETLPTGRFSALNEAFNGQDVTGVGGYRTGLGFNFEHLLPISEPIYLRTRFSFTYILPHPVSVRGINAYGGTPTTEGTIIPGQLISLNLATELALSQNLVAVMEGLYFNGAASKFRGYLGQSTTNTPAAIGRPSAYELSIAPAVEYNFTQRIGLIGGVWFPLLGRAAPNFTTYMLALNIYW